VERTHQHVASRTAHDRVRCCCVMAGSFQPNHGLFWVCFVFR
jgi:hypothetical protein